jgi:hypothetical protein
MELLGGRSDWRADTTGKDTANGHYAIFDKSLEAVDTDIAIVLRILDDDLDHAAIDTACVIDLLSGERHAIANIETPGCEGAGQVAQLADLDRA